MAKTVSSETTEQIFSSEASSMGNFVQGLESLNGTYTDGLSEIEESITNATNSMANWAPDEVQIKLEAFVSELSGAQGTIESDISGGSFLSMKNTASQLVTDLNGCKEAKKAYEEAKKDYATKKDKYNSTPSTIEEWHANSAIRKDNPAKKSAKTAMDTAEATMNSAKTTLDTKVQTTNTHFLELSQFVFNGTAESSSGTGEQTPPPPPPQEEQPEETSQQTGPESYENPQTVPINDVYDYLTGGTAGDITYDANNPANRSFSTYSYGILTNYNYYIDSEGRYVCDVSYTDAESGEPCGSVKYVSNADGTMTVTGEDGPVNTDAKFIVMSYETDGTTYDVPFLYQESMGTNKISSGGFNQGDASFIYAMEGENGNIYHNSPIQTDTTFSQYVQLGCLEGGQAWSFSGEFGNIYEMREVSSTSKDGE